MLTNAILNALVVEHRESLERYGRCVDLAANNILHESGDEQSHVFFLYSGMVTLLVVMAGNIIAEAGFVGAEGAIGDVTQRLSFTRAIVGVPGQALRVPIDFFENVLQRSPHFQSLMKQNGNRVAERAQQIAGCNLLHPLEARLCRWLLQVLDNSNEDASISITQDNLAQLLGVSRSRLNEKLKALSDIGAIERTQRGIFKVIDADAICDRACGCYRALKFTTLPIRRDM